MPPKAFVTMQPGSAPSYEESQVHLLRCDDLSDNPKARSLDELDAQGKPVACILCGPPGAGKSTWQKGSPAMQRMHKIDPDQIAKEIHEGKIPAVGSDGKSLAGRMVLKPATPKELRITDDMCKCVREVVKIRYTEALRSGRSVLLETYGRWRGHIEQITSEAKAAGHHVHLGLAYTDRENCLASNLGRDRTVPEDELTRTHEAVTKNWAAYSEIDAVDSADKKVR